MIQSFVLDKYLCRCNIGASTTSIADHISFLIMTIAQINEGLRSIVV